jgi:hypothetical protein
MTALGARLRDVRCVQDFAIGELSPWDERHNIFEFIALLWDR